MAAELPASPTARRLRHPSWLDPRLIVGVLLVLVSVLLGARVVAAADRSVQVWALAQDVSAGTALTPADLRPARVRLFESAEAYLRVSQSPAGRTVTRTLHGGELLPRSAVVATPPAAIVSIPIQPGNAPGLARGQLIDVWSTAKGCAPVQVLSRVAVQEVRVGGTGGLAVSPATTQVIVRVGPTEARRIIAALGSESTIRLVVLDGDLPRRAALTGSVQRCAPVGPGRGPAQPTPNATSEITPPSTSTGSAPTEAPSAGATPPASPTPTSGSR